MLNKSALRAGSIPAASTINSLILKGFAIQQTAPNRPKPPSLWHDSGTVYSAHSSVGATP
jgi:hypothetical protein